MNKLILRNVGDGLNLIINNSDCFDLTVDFGGNENINCYCCFYNSFLLSHFHADHYNGILNCKPPHCHWFLENFYHPAMPAFKESRQLMVCFLAMNIRISNNHPLQNTIFEYVRRLNKNKKPLKFKAVSKGDVIICGERKYEILWPPKKLTDKEALKDIRNAIKDFEEAKESDKKLSEIYQKISRRYAETENIYNLETDNTDDNNSLTEFDGKLSEVVQKANKSLRKAANRLSIAFRQDDNILFLGDLERREIHSVVTDLKKNHNVVYDILIAAHHGTHWHRSLNSINADICLASIGKTLKRNIKDEYKGICNKLVRTDEWGDIKITKINRAIRLCLNN
jgi:beta-lactamase superfamily II metal-dependent hydrolase